AGGTKLPEHERDLVALDQPADMLDSFWRTVGIVQRDVVDLAPPDAAIVIDRLHVCERAASNQADRGCRPAKRKNAADLDFGRRDTRRIGSVRAAGPSAHSGHQHCASELDAVDHESLPDRL